jgi:hypothetical protein
MESNRKLRPLLFGSTLALTIAIMYTLCAAAWAIWPEAALDFLNALFHGLDFRRIQLPPQVYSPKMFFLPLAVMTGWGFVIGALYAMLHNLLRR